MGVWIEIVSRMMVFASRRSHPLWVCGLKCNRYPRFHNICQVTPFMGVWIEISNGQMLCRTSLITPFMGGHIERDIILEFSQQVKQLLGKKLTKIILYGSYARGDNRENSDIDIMVLTTLTDDEIDKIETSIFDLAFDFQMEYDIDISVIVKNEDHFNYWLGALPFYDNVQNEGIVLNG